MVFYMVNLIAAIDPMTIIGIILLLGLLVALFIFPSINAKKRQKQITELYKSVEVGDKIKTVGGIIGTVIEINEINALESEIVIESGIGDNKTTLVFDMQAIYQNLSKVPTQASILAASHQGNYSDESHQDAPAAEESLAEESENNNSEQN